MFKRPLFWLGLLLGSLAALGSLRRRSPSADSHTALLNLAVLDPAILDLTFDALVVYDAAGSLVSSNAAARRLFGPGCSGLSSLCYPNGQRVPPGQLPHVRTSRSGKSVPQIEYHFASADGVVHVLHAFVSTLPHDGTAAVFRDVTALHLAHAHLDEALAQQAMLHRLGRRLSTADADAMVRVIVEEAHALLVSLPDVQVRLYEYNPAAQRLTRLASEPEDRPKRPKSAADAQPPEFSFDAGVPALWQIYVARQPSFDCPAMLGEAEAASAYALPLLSGGLAIGHLSLSSSANGAFDDLPLLQTLTTAASAAALALSIPHLVQLAKSYQAQLDAVREITQAIGSGASFGQLADAVSVQVRHVTNAAVCTLSAEVNGKLSVLGQAFRDELLHSERHKSNDPALQSKAAQKAWRTQKSVTHLGLINPSVEAGTWRVFAGRVGQHSVLALPLASRRGVLAVCWDGTMPLPDVQTKFLETVAALVSRGLKPATTEEAGAG